MLHVKDTFLLIFTNYARLPSVIMFNYNYCHGIVIVMQVLQIMNL
jgi:hypothetical protein